MPSHSSLTGAELHEPKGVETANNGEVYVADGAGSGAWIFAGSNVFGEIKTLESDAVSLSGIGTTPITLPFSQNGDASNITADASNNRLVLPNAGTYFVIFSASFSTTASGDAGTYEFKILDDGVSTGIEMAREMSGSNDTGSDAAIGLATVADDSVLTVSVESDDGGNTDNIDIYNMHLSAFKVS